MYRVRIPIALAMLALLGGVCYADTRLDTDAASVGLLAILVATALWEFHAILGLPRARNAVAVLVAVLLLAARYLEVRSPGTLPVEPVGLLLAGFAIFALVPWLLARDPDPPAGRSGSLPPPGGLGDAATVALGYLYVLFLLSFLLEIRFLRVPGSDLGTADGVLLVLFVVLSAKGADMGGYLVGKKFGKHKLIPRISPKKSWEGTIGGLALSAALAAASAHLLPPVRLLMSPAVAAAFGVGAGALSLAGDLVESSVKRRAGVKDSSRLIPEFGGILDLMDSLMFASAFAYYLLRFLIGRV